MKLKHIHFIINPASGKEEPVLFFINEALKETTIDWDVTVTRKNRGAGKIAKGLIGKTDLVVVYGGDGCVTAVAAALHGTKTPMAILPGGTANVMAKELAIPLETKAALELIQAGKYRIKAFDMGLMNGAPFLLRLNFGIMADMILETDRQMKNQIGQLAYGITAVKTVAEAEPVSYQLQIDGIKTNVTGVSLTITNSGHIGIGDFALQPGISMTDGLLDIILLKDNNLISLLKVAGSTLLQNETNAYQHWQCKQVTVKLAKKQAFICDDFKMESKKVTIKVVPASIHILVPR
ncbi:MAG: YegS/Rv2252/BmrU family lipid kinase [Bacteroidota bacterium]|nr:YegS/Rv2252/BmrU family lipid kinase [Bacteroidota bacterium]